MTAKLWLRRFCDCLVSEFLSLDTRSCVEKEDVVGTLQCFEDLYNMLTQCRHGRLQGHKSQHHCIIDIEAKDRDSGWDSAPVVVYNTLGPY